MEEEDLREVLRSYGVDLWSLIETSVALAARDHGAELRLRRDGIVAKLYSPPVPVAEVCRRCDSRVGDALEKPHGDQDPCEKGEEEEDDEEEEEGRDDEENELDQQRNGRVHRPIDPEQQQILAIKEHIEDPDQPEELLVKQLQRLADMDITFKALKETDVGRHVNGLRKHPSGEVRGLVKQLVRRWKDLVDEWVKSNSDGASPATMTDGDSPQAALLSSPHHQNSRQVPDFGTSPSPHTNGAAMEMELGPKVTARKEAAPPPPPPPPPPLQQQQKKKKPTYSTGSFISQSKAREPDGAIDNAERLASARRRLHENYQEAQNAKKQRTIQVMGIHEIPRPKNSRFPRPITTTTKVAAAAAEGKRH